jgi:hypothetical protein
MEPLVEYGEGKNNNIFNTLNCFIAYAKQHEDDKSSVIEIPILLKRSLALKEALTDFYAALDKSVGSPTPAYLQHIMAREPVQKEGQATSQTTAGDAVKNYAHKIQRNGVISEDFDIIRPMLAALRENGILSHTSFQETMENLQKKTGREPDTGKSL